MRKNLAIALFAILFISSLGVGGTIQAPASSSVNVESVHVDQPTSTADVAQPPVNDVGIVIFAKDKTELQTLAQLPGVTTVYDHLLAVRLTSSETGYQFLNYAFPGQTYRAEVIDNIKFNDPIPQQSVVKDRPSQIKIDSIEDANLMGVKPVWDAGYYGQNVVVAVMDNGVDFTHPALDDRKAGLFLLTNDYTPCRSHGTPVAGTIAATEGTLGNAYGAKIYDYSFGCFDGDALYGDVLKGFNDIIAKNATIDIINTSWGPDSNGGFPYEWITHRLEEVNIMLVGSAGNEGPGTFTTFSGAPGNAIQAVSAGAIDYSERRADFSSQGPSYKMISKPDVVAPGVGVNTTQLGGGYGLISGTSFSSPLTAGALATLISALKAKNINYNVGLVKAALLAGARDIGVDYSFGQGIPDIENSLNLIESASVGSGSIPQLVELTPQTSMPKYIAEVPKGVVVKVPLTLISSHPSSVSLSTGGGIAGASVDSPTSDSYSQIVYVHVDTSNTNVGGTITGTVTASLGSSSATSTITLKITTEKVATIGVDIRHTYWDETVSDTFGGTNTGEMIQLAIQNGYWVEEFDSVINPSLLNKYDILWMPDPLNLDGQQTETVGGVEKSLLNEKPLLQSEIDAIVDFVENGGNLWVDFNGYINDADGNPSGLNATGMNALISTFGITANEQAINPVGPLASNINNVTSITKGVQKLTHFGNYLELTGTAVGVNEVNFDGVPQVGTAIYTDPSSGGRVVVAATNFWMDNYGIPGTYRAGENDAIMALNTLNWFTQSKQLAPIESVITDDTISGKFLALDNGVPSDVAPEAFVAQTATIDEHPITLTDEGNGIYSFTIDVKTDGDWRVNVVFGDDYLLFNKIIDTTGPVITPDEKNLNGTIFESGTKFIVLSYVIDDLVSSVSKFDITLKLDGKKIEPTFGYDLASKELNIVMNSDYLNKTEGIRYTLTIEVYDTRDNFSKATFIFWIGEPTDMTSTTTTTTMTNSTTTDTGSDGNALPFAYLPVILLSLFAIPVVRRRYWRDT